MLYQINAITKINVKKSNIKKNQKSGVEVLNK